MAKAVKFLVLASAILVSCSHDELTTLSSSSSDWCNSGTDRSDSSWNKLDNDAISVVAPSYLNEAISRLKNKTHVRLSANDAAKIAEVPIASRKGEAFSLARAGILGAPGAFVNQYLRSARDRRMFRASVSPDRKDF